MQIECRLERAERIRCYILKQFGVARSLVFSEAVWSSSFFGFCFLLTGYKVDSEFLIFSCIFITSSLLSGVMSAISREKCNLILAHDRNNP